MASSSTGIIRRIDDLGRVVIPSELRRQFYINEGDPLVISATAGCITIRKYNAEKPLLERVKELAQIVTTEGENGDISSKMCEKLSDDLEQMMLHLREK